MILYDLRCSNGHRFEAWFLNSAAYDAQAAAGEVECPYCGDQAIEKAPMAPRLAKRRDGDERPAPAILDTNPERGGAARAEQVAREILKAFGQMRDHIEEHAEYVGRDFAEEARAIHYGEAEERPIYGEGTEEEADALKDEGIPFARIPLPTRRRS